MDQQLALVAAAPAAAAPELLGLLREVQVRAMQALACTCMACQGSHSCIPRCSALHTHCTAVAITWAPSADCMAELLSLVPG